jgi:O-antigen/teichoic acid export membrane protein
MKKRIAAFSAANLAGALLGMLGMLWASNLAGPRLMGIFNALQLVLVYAPVLALGVFNGLNRELPYSIGRQRHEDAGRLASAALYVCHAVCAIAFFGIAASAAGAWHRLDGDWILGLCVYALVVPLGLYRTYLEVTYRTTHDFAWLSAANVMMAATGLLLVALMYLQAWGGMLARTLLTAMLGAYLLWRRRPFRVLPAWDAAALRRLLATGLPIFAVGYLYLLFTSLDRLLILDGLGQEALGAYTPALLIVQGMAILPTSVAQVLYPRAAEQYGREGSLRNLGRLLFLPIPPLLLLQLPIVIAAWHFMDVLVLRFMPTFVQGVEAARWALLAGLALSLTFPAILFNVGRHQRLYAAIILVSIVVVTVAWRCNPERTLADGAIAMLAGTICFATLSGGAAWYLIRRDVHGTPEKAHS